MTTRLFLQGEVSPAVDTSTPAADMKRRQQQQGVCVCVCVCVCGGWRGSGSECRCGGGGTGTVKGAYMYHTCYTLFYSSLPLPPSLSLSSSPCGPDRVLGDTDRYVKATKEALLFGGWSLPG